MKTNLEHCGAPINLMNYWCSVDYWLRNIVLDKGLIHFLDK